MKIEMLSDSKKTKEDKLKEYSDNYDTEFDFIDTRSVVNNINTCENIIKDIVKE